MNHAAPIIAALAFAALGLSSTAARADVGFYVAPGTIAVSVGAPVVYAPPPPTTVVYVPPQPTTVVYRTAPPVAYHRDIYRAPSRPVVVYEPVCDHERDWRGPPAHAKAHGHHKNKKHKNRDRRDRDDDHGRDHDHDHHGQVAQYTPHHGRR